MATPYTPEVTGGGVNVRCSIRRSDAHCEVRCRKTVNRIGKSQRARDIGVFSTAAGRIAAKRAGIVDFINRDCHGDCIRILGRRVNRVVSE